MNSSPNMNLPPKHLPCQTSHIPWVEKYRPQKIKDVIQDDVIKTLLDGYITSGDIPHILLYGPPGTGKTSTIIAIGKEIFKEKFRDRVIEFNASDDRGINAVRENISNEAKKFVSTEMCEDGTMIPPYKIIILDEADSMTDEAQDALRVIIEKYSSVTRFCFICNYICKITDAIKSRCYPIYFKRLGNDQMMIKLSMISENEKMKLNDEIFQTIIDVSNGDMRKAVVILQNIKYMYHLNKTQHKKTSLMTATELKNVPIILQQGLETPFLHDDHDGFVTKKDVYDIFACIDNDLANNIIEDILKAKNTIELMDISKKTISLGYPIDNVIAQINKNIASSSKFTENEKAIILCHAGQVLYRMKMCANEYIQLLDYLTCVNNATK